MTMAIILAVVCSSLIFALVHIPHRIVNGLPLADVLPLAGSIARVFFYGLVFASFFLLTKNIFATAGLHALWNASPNLFEHSVNRFGTYGLLMILVSILLCNFIYSKYNREPQVE
jgi:membrane protease YdiL (CAAX protease family)